MAQPLRAHSNDLGLVENPTQGRNNVNLTKPIKYCLMESLGISFRTLFDGIIRNTYHIPLVPICLVKEQLHCCVAAYLLLMQSMLRDFVQCIVFPAWQAERTGLWNNSITFIPAKPPGRNSAPIFRSEKKELCVCKILSFSIKWLCWVNDTVQQKARLCRRQSRSRALIIRSTRQIFTFPSELVQCEVHALRRRRRADHRSFCLTPVGARRVK